MTEECKDFIRKCLKKDPEERLGAKGGLEEITSHPWFSDININDLIEKKI
jgi:serine/threonine protein kinase